MGIAWLATELTERRRPPEAELRRSLQEELDISVHSYPGPRYDLCAAAAALPADLDLWRQTVAADCDRDSYHYRQQKRAGFEKSNLGRYPSLEVSEERVRWSLNHLLPEVTPALAEEI